MFDYGGRDEAGRALWWVRCSCGKRVVKKSHYLVRGATTSCGCERNAFKRKGAKTTENISYKTHKKRAYKKKFKPLTREEWGAIVFKPCHYCNGFDIRGYRTDVSMTDKVFETMKVKLNGVDRVDNSKGYEFDNCVPCRLRCNVAKGVMSQDEFYSHIEKIYANRTFNKTR